MQLENKAHTVPPTKHSFFLCLCLCLCPRLMATRENPRCIDISLRKALRALPRSFGGKKRLVQAHRQVHLP
jgi:hypothetical protein